MADLKLGRLAKQGMVRLTIVLSEPLKEELDAYAAEHAKLYEPIETHSIDTAHAGGLYPRRSRLAQPPKTVGAGAKRSGD